MPDSKISALVAKATPAAADLLVIVDVTDTTMAPSGTDKKATVGGLVLAESQVTGLTAALAALQPAGASGAVQFNDAGAPGGFGSWDGTTFSAGHISAPATAASFATERFGAGAAPNVTTPFNTVLGSGAAPDLTTGTTNTIVGLLAAGGLTTGSANLLLGSQSTVPAALGGSILLGSQTTVSGVGSNVISIGSAQAIAHNDVIVLGTSTASTRDGQLLTGQNTAAWTLTGPTTLQERPVAELRRSLPATADASYTGQIDVGVYDAAGFRTGLTIGTDGTRALIGFFGVAPAARPAAPATLADVIAALRSLGLCS